MNDLGNSGSSKTIVLPENYNAMLTCSLSANCTFTMPSPVNGYQFSLLLKQDATGGRTATFTNVRWPNSTAPTISTTILNMDIINFFSDGNYWYGYYSNSQNFDSYAGQDRYFNSVSLLLNMDGSGNTFTDFSGTSKTITVGGSATQSATQSKFGGSSLYLDGSSWIGSSASAAFGMGTGDFTCEGWYYPTSNSTTFANLFNFGDYTTGVLMRLAGSSTGGDWLFFAGRQLMSGTRLSPTQVPANTWTHIALVRSSGVVSVYVNGSLFDQQSGVTSDIGSSRTLTIGRAAHNSTEYFTGYMDDIRITKGLARYTGATITVPTAAFPNSF
jgi:hypothetical protein